MNEPAGGNFYKLLQEFIKISGGHYEYRDVHPCKDCPHRKHRQLKKWLFVDNLRQLWLFSDRGHGIPAEWSAPFRSLPITAGGWFHFRSNPG